MQHSQQLFERALAVIPGGVNSPVRAFGAVGGQPPFIAEAHGARLRDVDGTDYIDYVCSWGAVILGHAAPTVVQAVQAAAARGLSFGAPTGAEVELAETLCRLVPGMEQVRLVNSGTEATMSAIRLARAATGRDAAGQVRRLLPRPRRQPAGERRLRRADLRRAQLARRAGGTGRADADRAVQRSGRRRGAVRRARRGHRGGHRRAGGRQHGLRAAAAGFPGGPAPGL